MEQYMTGTTGSNGTNISNTSQSSSSHAGTNYEIHHSQLTSLWRERDLRRRMFTLEYVKRRNATLLSQTTLPVPPASTTTTTTIAPPSAANAERRRRMLALSLERTGVELIPCRIEIEHDGYKLSEVFLLEAEGSNVNGSDGANSQSAGTPNNTPSQQAIDLLAAQVTAEYDLPADPFTGLIAKFLREQVDEFSLLKQDLSSNPNSPNTSNLPPALPAVPLRIDIIVGLTRLEDRLEIDLLAPCSTLAALVSEYSVTGLSATELAPFRPLLLHNLLEQQLLWRKAILWGGWHRDPRTGALRFHDPDVQAQLPASSTIRRPHSLFDTFSPSVTQLTPASLDRLEASREREGRRKRRTKPALPGSGKSAAVAASVVNLLTGSVRSPPRTLPTPTSYRGSLHRVIQSRLLVDDEEAGAGASSSGSGGKRRGRR